MIIKAGHVLERERKKERKRERDGGREKGVMYLAFVLSSDLPQREKAELLWVTERLHQP